MRESRARLRINFGTLRVGLLRSSFIVTIINTFMLAGLFITENGWSNWYLVAPLIFVLYVFFELKVVWKQEIDGAIENSEMWQELLCNMEKIKNDIENIRLSKAPKV